MLGWNPSYDFRLFDVGWASPLQANEFGAATSFRSSDPVRFVDYSLNQLAAVLQPNNSRPFAQRQLPVPIEEIPFVDFFQSQESSSQVRERLQRVRDEADRLLREAGGTGGPDCPQGRNILGGCGPILGSKPNKPGDTTGGVGDDPAHSGQKVTEWLKALPAGSGVFLIAVAVIILLLLFAKGR